MWKEVVFGLLASQCCVVQLVLNYLALPCAGFAVLTPYRPIFLSLVVVNILHNVYRYPLKLRTWVVVLCTLLLAASPEIVQHINHSMVPSTRMLEYHVHGIKCEACAHRIKQTIQALPHVQGVRVDYQDQRVVVSMLGDEHYQLMSDKITWALRGLDYQAHFVGML